MKDLAQALTEEAFQEDIWKVRRKGHDELRKPKTGEFIWEGTFHDNYSQTVKIALEDELAMGDGIEVWNGEEQSPGTVVTE